MKKLNFIQRIGLAGLFIACLPLVLQAQEDPQGPTVLGGASRVGTAAAQFLQLGACAHAGGMGETYVAHVSHACAAFYNAGALALIDKQEAIFTHTNLPAGLAHFFGSYAQPLGSFGTVALSAIVLTTGDIPVTVAFQGPTGEMYSVSQMAIGLSYSRNLTNRFAVGGTAKYIAEDLAGFESRTVAFDIGTIYQTGFRHTKIGMSIANFGPDITYGSSSSVGFDSQGFPMPITFRFGVVVDLLHTESNKLWLAAELNQPNDNLRNQRIGVEYSMNDMVFLRGGWKIDEESDGLDSDGFAESLSAGAGLNLSVSGINGKFDVSWSQMSYLDDLVRFSVLLGF